MPMDGGAEMDGLDGKALSLSKRSRPQTLGDALACQIPCLPDTGPSVGAGHDALPAGETHQSRASAVRGRQKLQLSRASIRRRLRHRLLRPAGIAGMRPLRPRHRGANSPVLLKTGFRHKASAVLITASLARAPTRRGSPACPGLLDGSALTGYRLPTSPLLLARLTHGPLLIQKVWLPAHRPCGIAGFFARYPPLVRSPRLPFHFKHAP